MIVFESSDSSLYNSWNNKLQKPSFKPTPPLVMAHQNRHTQMGCLRQANQWFIAPYKVNPKIGKNFTPSERFFFSWKLSVKLEKLAKLSSGKKQEPTTAEKASSQLDKRKSNKLRDRRLRERETLTREQKIRKICHMSGSVYERQNTSGHTSKPHTNISSVIFVTHVKVT